MNMRNPILLFAAFLCACQFSPPAQAAMIRNVTVANVYSEFINGTDLRTATNLLNGSGLFGNFHTLSPQGSMWLTGPVTAPPDGDYTNAFVTFDLGAIHILDQMQVWNYNQANPNAGRGIQRADIFTSTDGVNFTTNLPNFLFNRA